MIQKFLQQLLAAARVKIIEHLMNGDADLACKVSDNILDAVENLTARFDKDPEHTSTFEHAVQEARSLHTLICGTGYEADEGAQESAPNEHPTP